MDNVCHTLVGAACGEAGLKRMTRYGNATLMLASNLPDVDALVFLTDASTVAFRRGWTHGVLAQLLLPIVLAGIVWTFARLRPARDAADGPPVRIGWLLALGYLGVYTHVFLDYLNNYGVRLLAPLDWRWIYGDAVFIVDPWLWLMLGAGIWVARRQTRAVPARASLVFAACYIAAMLLSARAARAAVVEIWRDTRGGEPRALMVGPMPLTPFTRTVIVDEGDRYVTGSFSWRHGLSLEPEVVPKNDRHAAVAVACEIEDVRDFLVWSRFPFWVTEERPDGTHVTVADVRFSGAAGAPRAGFAARAVIPRAGD